MKNLIILRGNSGSGKTTVAKELLKYGNAHSQVVILEGIMCTQWYKSLFELANELYGKNIFAYYFAIPFEETLRCHNTRAKCNEFGETEMRRWWIEKDYSEVLAERCITEERELSGIVEEIYNSVILC